jgi:hypothetical protein
MPSVFGFEFTGGGRLTRNKPQSGQVAHSSSSSARGLVLSVASIPLTKSLGMAAKKSVLAATDRAALTKPVRNRVYRFVKKFNERMHRNRCDNVELRVIAFPEKRTALPASWQACLYMEADGKFMYPEQMLVVLWDTRGDTCLSGMTASMDAESRDDTGTINFDIESRTNEEFGGHGLNTLMRAILIHCIALVHPSAHVKSFPVNPISTWNLRHYKWEGVNNEFEPDKQVPTQAELVRHAGASMADPEWYTDGFYIHIHTGNNRAVADKMIDSVLGRASFKMFCRDGRLRASPRTDLFVDLVRRPQDLVTASRVFQPAAHAEQEALWFRTLVATAKSLDAPGLAILEELGLFRNGLFLENFNITPLSFDMQEKAKKLFRTMRSAKKREGLVQVEAAVPAVPAVPAAD